MQNNSHNETDLNHHNLPRTDWNNIQDILLHLNWISLVCCLFVVMTFLLFKREFPRSMPLQLGVVTCLLHAGLLMGPVMGFDGLFQMKSYCYIQASILQYSSVAIGCWLFNIALHLYYIIVKKWTYQKSLRLVPFLHLFGWVFPLVTIIPPLAAKKMVDRNFWCWVSNESNGVWELSCFYIPVMIILILTSVLWIILLIRICKISTQFKTVSYSIQSMLIIFFLSISFAFQCAHRIYNHSGQDSFVLELLHTVTLSSIGLVVFFVYGLNYDNIQLYTRLFKKFFCCCNNLQNTTTVVESLITPIENEPLIN